MFFAAVGVSAEPTVELQLHRTSLEMQAVGIPAGAVTDALEKGYRTILYFEVQLIDPERIVGDVIWEQTVRHILRRDPFDGVMHLEIATGRENQLRRSGWHSRFTHAEIGLTDFVLSELRQGMVLRGRAVWEPIYLIPGLRFLTAFLPGLQRTGPWTELQHTEDEVAYAIP